MRILLNFIILLSFGVFYANSNSTPKKSEVLIDELKNEDVFTASTTPTLAEYCNARYEFCINYPAEYFDDTKRADNADGIILKSEDELVRLAISGSYNVLDWSLEDIYLQTFEEIAKDEDAVNLVDYSIEENMHDCVYEFKDYFLYMKTILLEEKYVTVRLEVNKSNGYLLPIIQEQMTISVEL